MSFLLMLAMMCFDTMILVLGEGEMVGDNSSDSGLVSCRQGDSVETLLILRYPLLCSPLARPRLTPSKKTTLTWSRLSRVVIS